MARFSIRAIAQQSAALDLCTKSLLKSRVKRKQSLMEPFHTDDRTTMWTWAKGTCDCWISRQSKSEVAVSNVQEIIWKMLNVARLEQA
jgi:hypothetical protein